MTTRTMDTPELKTPAKAAGPEGGLLLGSLRQFQTDPGRLGLDGLEPARGETLRRGGIGVAAHHHPRAPGLIQEHPNSRRDECGHGCPFREKNRWMNLRREVSAIRWAGAAAWRSSSPSASATGVQSSENWPTAR